METNANIRAGRVLIESSIQAIKTADINGKYSVTLALEIPLGVKNESETLSALDKFLRAVRQFSEDDRAHVVVNIPLIHERQEEVLNGIKSSYEKVMELAQAPKLEKA